MNSFRGMSRISRKEWRQALDGSADPIYFLYFPKTRKRSRRIRTACLPTVRDSVAMLPDDSTSGGPDMIKFEQVKSDCHEMSLGDQGQGWGSHVQKDWARGVCTVSPNASWIMVTQTHTTENIIFQQFHSRAAKNL